MEDIPALDKNKKHTIDLVIDRLVIKDGIRGRLADSVELALRYGEGRIIVNEPDKGADGDTLHATESVCPVCKIRRALFTSTASGPFTARMYSNSSCQCHATE